MRSGTAKTLKVIAIAVAVSAGVWLLSDIVAAIFLATLIAVILRGLASWVARHTRLPAPLAVGAVMLCLALVFGALAYRIAPKLADEVQALWASLSGQVQGLRSFHGPAWLQSIFHNLSASNTLGTHIATSTSAVLMLTAHGLLTLAVLLVSAFYFALDPETYLHGVVQLFAPAYRARARFILESAGKTLLHWSVGQLVEMAVVGVIVAVGLYFLDVPLALALAVLAGLLTFIPYFGAIAATVPALMMGFSVSWQTALWVLGIFLLCHIIEGYLVGPSIQRRTVRLPPALTVLSMTILGTLFGPLGIVIGAPVAAVMLVVVREAYVIDVLDGGRRADPAVRERRPL